MTTVNMPAKRHHQWLPSGGATAMDGADDENVVEAVHPACQKELTLFGSCGSGATQVFTARDPDVKSKIPHDPIG